MKTAAILFLLVATFAAYEAEAECVCQQIDNPVCAGSPVVKYSNMCEADCFAAALNNAYEYDITNDECVAV